VRPETELLDDEVHLWWARLDAPAARIRQLADMLAPDEVERASRFHGERDRGRWIVGRGILRERLADYVGCMPGEVRLVYGPHGKPALAPDAGCPSLRFSVSHSESLVVYAITRNCALGVDVEVVRPIADLEGIAEYFFSPRERAALRALGPHERIAGFFNCWTRKEAYVKAIGFGLAQPLDAFDVELRPGAQAGLLAIDGDPHPAAEWSLHHLDAPRGVTAALAIVGNAQRFITHWLN
jgi:4'-phosphopantetheinyl transferase